MSRRTLPVLASLLVLAACGKPPQMKMPPAAVGVITIQETPVALTADLPGRTSPFAVSEIRPQITGIVKARLFVEGSTVKAGQALYQIDPAPYQAAYESAQASLASTKVKAERYAALLAANAIAPQEADDAKAELTTQLKKQLDDALNLAHFADFRPSLLSRPLLEWYQQQQEILQLLRTASAPPP